MGGIMDDKAKKNFTLQLDYRFIIYILLVVIVTMFAIWRPWSTGSKDNARTVTVTGEATILAEPDEYVFYPSYSYKNSDKAAALAELTTQSEEITKQVKALGVADNKIKVDSSNYNYYYDSNDKTTTYTLQFTIYASSKEQAQKVQDYLVTTLPEGQVTPQATFSETTQKDLKDKGREQASKDAREKAESTANNLGFKIGKVKSVNDNGNSLDPIYPMPSYRVSDDAVSSKPQSSLPIQPGQNEITYTVSVTYFVK